MTYLKSEHNRPLGIRARVKLAFRGENQPSTANIEGGPQFRGGARNGGPVNSDHVEDGYS